MLAVSVKSNPCFQYSIKIGGKKMLGEVKLADFVEVKGWKAVGKKLSDQKLTGVTELVSEEIEEITAIEPISTPSVSDEKMDDISDESSKYQAGDTIEFDFN